MGIYNMKVTAIFPDYIDEVWPQVKGYVQMCLDTSYKHNAVGAEIFDVEQTKEHMKKGNGLMLVVHDNIKIYASLMVEVLNTIDGRSLNLSSMGGESIYSWNMELLAKLKEVAETYGCNNIVIHMVRKGWRRALKPYGFVDIGKRVYAGTEYEAISLSIKGNGDIDQ